MEDLASNNQPPAGAADLSIVLVSLLKGVQYREADERLWSALLNLQARVRDQAGILNLELILDEAEGYAFLKSRPDPSPDDPAPRLPRLVARRPLSFPVSLLLALLRKKMAEFDASGGDSRLVLSRDDIVELIRVFLPEGPNEAKLIDQVDATVAKVADLGFLHKLKSASALATGPSNFEVRRILKAFVDAQWLADFDVRLSAYQSALSGKAEPKEKADE
jgi:hypothetical protein